MATTPKKTEKFEFLNLLDGQVYNLPPFDKSLVVDAVAKHKETISELPSMYEALTSDDPLLMEESLAVRQRELAWLSTMGIVQTIDAHIPDPDDPAKAAIIANLNAQTRESFSWLWETYAKWVKASGEEVENEQGEG